MTPDVARKVLTALFTPPDPGETRQCQLCGAGRDDLLAILDLGEQPLAERDDGNRYPLGLLQCDACGLIQLSYQVERDEVFPPDHPYATGNTRAMRLHFGRLAREISPLLNVRDLVVDIGANDGTLLEAVRRADPDARLLAVEPTGQADVCRARDIPVAQQPWSSGLAAGTWSALGPARVITASNVLAHVADPHDFMEGISILLADGGTFVTENHDAASVIGGLQIDTVYHEHLRFFTPATLGRLLEMHGFLVTRTENIPTHGGSFRTWAIRSPQQLQARAETARDQLCRLLEVTSEKGEIWGVGASTRATPLIHFAGLGRWLKAIAEVPGSAKIGTKMPGTSIPVVDERWLIEAAPPAVLLLSWHIASDIVPKLRAAGYLGDVIIPLPAPRIYRG
jgi:C-methyltransferase C-terminal domain/Methyltransferase domain/Putative zinc binding domain